MIIDQNSITYIALLLICSIMGYLYGRLNCPCSGVLYDNSNFTDKNAKVIKNNISQQKPLIKIDETKFVTEIDTASMEKKFDSLGEVKTSEDNLGDSINKLKNIKR
jgi:hypothetical protein